MQDRAQAHGLQSHDLHEHTRTELTGNSCFVTSIIHYFCISGFRPVRLHKAHGIRGISCYNKPMNESDKSALNARTPEQAHARERFWQILFPLVVVCVLLTAGFALLLLYSGELGSSTEGMAAAALVSIALPIMLLSLVFLLILVALITGAAKASAWLPGAGAEVLAVFRSINAGTQRGSQALVAPLLTVGQKTAELQHISAELRSRLTKGKVR